VSTAGTFGLTGKTAVEMTSFGYQVSFVSRTIEFR